MSSTNFQLDMIDYTLFNSDKSLLRCTTDRIPSTTHAIRESGIPYGLIVKPYGDLVSFI
jgi:hypothetical protein